MSKITTILKINHITKSFPEHPSLLTDVSFNVKSAETVCLLGDSGSGKTTLLRIIAGLEQADWGDILFDGQKITEIPAHKRDFGFMFQGFALFPHLNVKKNIAFGLEVRDCPKNKVKKGIKSLLKLMGLEGFEKRDVYQLSEGQRQRVALARCLAPEPKLLLLDEPTSSLDYKIKQKLLRELREIIRRLKLPAIYVTHDYPEAQVVSDRILLLENGKISKVGPSYFKKVKITGTSEQ